MVTEGTHAVRYLAECPDELSRRQEPSWALQIKFGGYLSRVQIATVASPNPVFLNLHGSAFPRPTRSRHDMLHNPIVSEGREARALRLTLEEETAANAGWRSLAPSDP